MSNITPELAQAALAAIKTELDGGFAYLFAGAVPAGPEVALDMATVHTQVAKLSLAGDGVTGLTFDAAADFVLSKPGAAVWSGLVDFDGLVAGPGTITPTFFRICAAGDNGRAAGVAGFRLQGTVGGPTSSAAMKLGGGDTLTDNGTNTTSAAVFNVRVSSLG